MIRSVKPGNKCMDKIPDISFKQYSNGILVNILSMMKMNFFLET